MKYRTAGAFADALNDHLHRLQQQTGLSVPRLRKRIAAERFLARLQQVNPTGWVLKGGVALEFRLDHRARMTKDLDLARADTEAAGVAAVQEAARLDLGDHFLYSVERQREIEALLEEAAALRFGVRVELGGRVFERIVVDVGFGDPLPWQPDLLPTHDLLSFAEVPTVLIPVLPMPYHVAEKVHAYTKRYGQRQDRSTREKDLVDLVLISGVVRIRPGELRAALEDVFAHRATHPLPQALPPTPSGWGRLYQRLAEAVGIETDMHAGHRAVASFLDPILQSSLPSGASWDPTQQSWQSPDVDR